MKRTIDTHVLGCKVNYADTRRILKQLPDSLTGNIALVGTCCVTAEGEKQSRKQVRRAARRLGDGGTVLVSGCASRMHPESFRAIADNVVVLDGDPDAAAFQATGLPAGGGAERDDDDSVPATAMELPEDRSRTRYFLKVQDGCANNCSYCVIPSVRGRPRSVPVEQLLEEAGQALASGFAELVISGINVGAYRDGGTGLGGLMEQLSRLDGLLRLRLSSIELVHLTEGLLEALAGLENFAPHLHVPMQSGDDRILEDMGRRYDSERFADMIAASRRSLPGLNVTTDAIVGYPGENERAFENTLELVQAIGATKIHVFIFSPRPGTAAADRPDPIPSSVARARSRRLRAQSDRAGQAHHRRKLGRVSEVLLESVEEAGEMSGFSGDYTRFVVHTGADDNPVLASGTVVPVLGTGVNGGLVTGKVIE